MSDKARGSLMLLTAVLAFLYYTFWTLLLVSASNISRFLAIAHLYVLSTAIL